MVEKLIDLKKTTYYKNWNKLLNNKKLIEYIEEKNIEILFYQHMNMQQYLNEFKSKSKNIKILNLDYDIQQVLKESSLLVTDYSSVFMDFAYMKKPIIYFQFDKKEFRKKQYQEGYFSYEKDGFGDIAQTVEDTVNKIINYIEKKYKLEKKYLNKMNSFYELYDKNNCERIYQLLKKEN